MTYDDFSKINHRYTLIVLPSNEALHLTNFNVCSTKSLVTLVCTETYVIYV